MIALWTKITAAASLELAALGMLFNASSTAYLVSYFLLHALASLVTAFLTWALLPSRYKRPFAPSYALLWTFAFFIPVLGVSALLIAVQVARRFPRMLHTERYVTVSMPEFSGVQREAPQRKDLRAGDARRILRDTALPLDTRLCVLLALQVIQPKAAVPLLIGLLADPSEDIRLLAYSMVDTWEKDLTQQIQDALSMLEKADLASSNSVSGSDNVEDSTQAQTQIAKINALRRLAELHWMQADTGLARGDLKRFALEKAHLYCVQVLWIAANDHGIWQLYAKVLIELNQLEAAMRAVNLAEKLQMPAAQAWTLLGQIAYLQRDFNAVRKYAALLPEPATLPPSAAGNAVYWQHRRISKVDLSV